LVDLLDGEIWEDIYINQNGSERKDLSKGRMIQVVKAVIDFLRDKLDLHFGDTDFIFDCGLGKKWFGFHVEWDKGYWLTAFDYVFGDFDRIKVKRGQPFALGRV
jgi:hypothetical protein